MRILILTGSPQSYSIKRLKDEAEKKGHIVEIENPIDLMAYISTTTTGHDRIYKKSEGENDVKRVLAKNFDVIIPRFAGATIFEYGCAVLEHLSGNMHIPTTSWAFGLRVASNKFLSVQAFSQAKVKTTKSIFAFKPTDFGFIVKELGGFPIVCKTLAGSQGAGVFILNDALSASTTLGAFSKLGINLLLQQFIDSGRPASDIRAYVVNGKVSAAYRRYSLDGDFRSNYSLSKSGETVTLTEEQHNLAIGAALAVGLDVCAVDIITEKKTGIDYVIECNGNGNLQGIEKITRANVAKDIIEFAEKIAKKDKNDQKQAETDTSAITSKIKTDFAASKPLEAPGDSQAKQIFNTISNLKSEK